MLALVLAVVHVAAVDPVAPSIARVEAPAVVTVVAFGKSVNVDEAAWAKLPVTTTTAKDKDGTSHTYAGVTVRALLEAQGAPFGEKLRGAALANVVVVEAADGYKASFGAADVDADLSGDVVIVARSRDGQALDASRGPLQLIVTGDKRPTRHVRQVVRIRMLTVP